MYNRIYDNKPDVSKNIFYRKAAGAAAMILILFSGFALGRLAGIQLITELLQGRRYALLIYRPPVKYIYIAGLLSSGNELKRLEGYYSLLDNRIIDTDLLIDRYNEESPLIKPAIVWILGYSGKKEKVLDFLSGEYNGADARIRKEILRTMERLDSSFYKKFITEHVKDKK